MKYLKAYKLFENLNTPISIEQFLSEINFPAEIRSQVVNWWNQNRSHIKIYHFNFKEGRPIMGVPLGCDEIAINKRLIIPPNMKMFLSLHESKHCDQEREGRFTNNYYDTVVNGNKEQFLENYRQLEREANDFAINSMRELGFSREMDIQEVRLRSNELFGEMVFRDMTEDITKYNSTDFYDLLKKQIL